MRMVSETRAKPTGGRIGISTDSLKLSSPNFAVSLAVITPTPDPLNQTLVAVPLIVLYEVGILLSRVF